MRLVLLALSLLVGFSCAAQAQSKSINLLIWEAYVSPDVIAEFTKRTGITIHQIYFDTGDRRDEILSTAGSNIDAVIINESGARLFGDKGVLAKRNKSPGASDPLGKRFLDRCGDNAQPYLWGTLGIAYRSDVVASVDPTWKSLLEPSDNLRGHIAMMEDYSDSLVPSLVTLGKSINSTDTETLKAAFEIMKKQAPAVLTYRYAISAIQDPKIGKDIHIALAYSGDEKTLSDLSGKPGVWKYVIPKEGTLVWLDCLAVLQGSANQAEAQQFADFLAEKETAASNATWLGLPPGNPEALPLLPEAMRDEIAAMNAQTLFEKGEFAQMMPGAGVQIRKRMMSTLVNFHVAQ